MEYLKANTLLKSVLMTFFWFLVFLEIPWIVKILLNFNCSKNSVIRELPLLILLIKTALFIYF